MFSDVSAEYTKGYTPGKGTITAEAGFSDPSKGHETKIAEGLIKSIGGDVLHIDNSGNVTKPDIEWHGKQWEIKQTSSVNSIDKQTQKVLEQIDGKHGNVIIDNVGTEFSLYQRTVINRVRRSAKDDCDICIFQNGNYIKIIRYQKR